MTALSRRSLLQLSGALFVSLSLTPSLLAAPKDDRDIGPCLSIDMSGLITVYSPAPDMGQGLITSAAMIIAEELDLDMGSITVKDMPLLMELEEDGHMGFGKFSQGSGGSQSTMRYWDALRQSSAFSRALLLEAAAITWDVHPNTLCTQGGSVHHANSGRNMPYGDLVLTASTLKIDASKITPKKAADRRILGKDRRSVVAPDIVTGKPIYGIDADIPGMRHAVIRRSPYMKGKIVSSNQDTVAQMKGVLKIVEMPQKPHPNGGRWLESGLAVVADSFWHAKKAAEGLEISWDSSLSVDTDSIKLRNEAEKTLSSGQPLREAISTGNIAEEFDAAARIYEHSYYHPNWAHTLLEPPSCIAHVKQDEAEVWAAYQHLNGAPNAAFDLFGINPKKVKVHTYRMGTSFGRKSETDYLAEALYISKEMQEPVKVTWTREDELEQSFPNGMGLYKISAGVNDKGDITAWHVRSAGSVAQAVSTRDFPAPFVKSAKGEAVKIDNEITHGAWRGPGHNTAAWVVQSMLNEIAHAEGQDPLDYLLSLYEGKGKIKSRNWPRGDIDLNRYVAALKEVATASNYKSARPQGWGRGIAVHHTFVSTAAMVVDIEMLGKSDFRVRKVTAAIDCGLALNPIGIRAQVESGIHDGLCAALYGNLTYKNGRVEQRNFDTYQKMRIDEAPPEINTIIMDMGDTKPRGTGETALPPFIPALTNALFDATGIRIRELPIKNQLRDAIA